MDKFVKNFEIIAAQVDRHKFKWRLKAVPSVTWDDVRQLLLIHIWKKIDQWDETRPIEPWVNTIVNNQLINMLRNLYGRYARPCINCPANQGGDLCSIYGTQNEDCSILRQWYNNKKSAHDTKLPLPLENHQQEVFNISSPDSDLSYIMEELHYKLKNELTPYQYKVYKLIYVEQKSDKDVILKLGYKINEDGKSTGFKNINTIKKIIAKKARELIYKDV